MHRRLFLVAAAMLLAVPRLAIAHALPGTEIKFSRDGTGFKMVITIPVAELVLALPFRTVAQSDALVKNHYDGLNRYILKHVVLKTQDGQTIAVSVTGIKTYIANDHHVGDYETVIVTLEGVEEQAQPLLLNYDAVIHRVATHRATVMSNQSGSLKKVGTIKYDFAGKTIAPVEIR